MKPLSTASDVCDLFRRKGWVTANAPVQVNAMTGGVSCHTWKVVSSNSRWVLKQPLAKLATEVEWFSDVKRIDREAEVIRLLSKILEIDAVPTLKFVDDETHSIVMTCAPDEAENWKTQMMAGLPLEKTAANAGKLLDQLHTRSRQISVVEQSKFDDIQNFEELRIEPFHKYVGVKHPDLQPYIEILIDSLRYRRNCLTHGDYSPKNMLVMPDSRIILLDFEVAHWGNPVFDLAYCIGHLMLKGWALDRREDCGDLISAFLEAYTSATDLLLPHLGLMLLARLDGTSIVDYVVDLDLRSKIRSIAVSWIRLAQTPIVVEHPKRCDIQISRALCS